VTRPPSFTGLLRQSIPVILDLGSQIAFWTLEIMLVGRLGGLPGLSPLERATDLGTQAIVAVGTVQLVLLVTITILLTFVGGAVVAINRHLGAGKQDTANHFFGQSVLWALLASIPIALVWSFGAPLLSRLLIGSGSDVARQMLVEYLRTMALFSPLLVVNFVVLGIFRGIGDSRLSMGVSLIVNSLHLLGAFLLVFGFAGLPALGVRGSALAGGIAHSVGALITAGLVFTGRSRLRLRRRDLRRMVTRTTRRLLRKGLPMTLEQLSWGLGMLALVAVATRLGTHSGAAHIALLSLLRISALIFTGLGIATMTVVGQQVGAGREDLARKATSRLMRLGLGAAAVLGLLVLIIPEPMIRLFSPDPEVVQLGGSVLVILAILQFPKAVTYISSYGLRGRGDTKFPMAVIIGGVIIFELGLGWTLAFPVGLGLGGIWIASLVDELLRAFLVTRRFYGRSWGKPPGRRSGEEPVDPPAGPAGDPSSVDKDGLEIA
jgi:putative MATE family efflux protein